MSVAANAVADLAAPPPPPRAQANAGDDQSDAPSFQDHVDANDRADRPDRPAPHQDRSERAQTKSDARPQASETQSAQTKPSTQSKDASAGDEAQDAHTDHVDTQSDAAQPPIFLQLIANAVAPIAAAQAQQTQAAQQDAAATAEQSQAQTNAAQAATVAAPTPAPAKPPQKSDNTTRSTHTKPAKSDAAKTDAAPTADNAKSATAPETTVPAAQTPATPMIVPASVATLGESNSDANAKPDAIEGAQAAPTRGAQPQPKPAQQSRQAAPTPSAPLVNVPETPPQTDASNKSRDAAKTLTQADAVKQVVQNLAAAADASPQAPAPTPPASTAAAVTHAQLATPVEQATSPGSADARTQAAPVGAQIGGEIVRRFNGQDTSFQMRLDPPDLGRVDIRLDVSRDHRVTAVISADNPQALSDLSRGAKELQQALQSSGLNLSDDGLRFDLSSGGQGNNFAQADQSNNRGASAHGQNANAQTQTPETPVSRPLRIDSWRGSRIDLVA